MNMASEVKSHVWADVLADAAPGENAVPISDSRPLRIPEGMTLPNFLLMGAMKAGTTALYGQLNQHPQIYMSPVKEPHFFVREGMQYSDPSMITTLEAYAALFKGAKDEKARGEASPSYLSWPGVPERIYRYLPDAKLMAILRNPAERAHSHFLHEITTGRESLTDFAAALQGERTQDAEALTRSKLPVRRYLQIGFYATHLKRYFELFDRDQIKVYLYEDFTRDPASMIQDVFRFLGVDDTFVPDQSTHFQGGVPRIKALHKLHRKPNPVKTVFRHLLPSKMRRSMAARINNLNRVKVPFEPEVRRELIETYREDILELQGLIGRDLSAWLDFKPERA
jgi:Sulfotransferase domain